MMNVELQMTNESVAQLSICHPELDSGSKNRIILDAEIPLYGSASQNPAIEAESRKREIP